MPFLLVEGGGLPTIDILSNTTVTTVLTWAIPLALGIGFLRWGVHKVVGR